MVARALGKLLHMVGILATDKVTEVQRTDLVGEFVGHTGPKTRRKVRVVALCLNNAYYLVLGGLAVLTLAFKFLLAQYEMTIYF